MASAFKVSSIDKEPQSIFLLPPFRVKIQGVMELRRSVRMERPMKRQKRRSGSAKEGSRSHSESERKKSSVH